MRCLQALGDFERLSQVTQEKWLNATVRNCVTTVSLFIILNLIQDDVRKLIAPMGAAAAWALWYN